MRKISAIRIARHTNNRERVIYIMIAFLGTIDHFLEFISLGTLASEFRLNVLFGCDTENWISRKITFVEMLKTFNRESY